MYRLTSQLPSTAGATAAEPTLKVNLKIQKKTK